MINDEIATIFENMSRVLSFLEASRYRARASRKGGDRLRIMAYQWAALSLRDLKEENNCKGSQAERDTRRRN